MESHEKNGPVLRQNVALTALGMQASGWFIGGTRKERRCFAAECGPDPFGHTRALEGPFSDPRLRCVCFRVRNIICLIIVPVLAFEVLRNTCTQTSTYL